MTENPTAEPASRTSDAARLATRIAIGGGLVLLAGGALLLWTSQGAGVFLESAFAAVIACF